jgi:hypothetical protein
MMIRPTDPDVLLPLAVLALLVAWLIWRFA